MSDDTKQVSIRMPKSLIKQLQESADANRRTLSAEIITILETIAKHSQIGQPPVFIVLSKKGK